MPIKETPFYVMSASATFIRTFDELFTRFEEGGMNTLSMIVDKEMVENGDVTHLLQLIMSLQHKPQLIEKMIFSLDIKFTEIEDSDLFLPETYWKTDVEYYRWFRKLGISPVMIFFLQDEDARFYTLAGDLLADNRLEVKPGDMKGKQLVGISGEALEEIMNRLFNSCWWMLVFCYGSGFNPQPYIEGLLADLDLPLTYEQVYEAFKEDLKKGINFKTSSSE